MGERNLNVDLLRILATFMVCVLHICGQGGVLESIAKPYGAQWMAAWLPEVLSFGAVNLYALVSGYVGLSSRFRLSRFALLWLQAFSSMALVDLVFALVSPGLITKETVVATFLPITCKVYWYLSSYFGVMVFAPVLSAGVGRLDLRVAKVLVPLSLLILSFASTFGGARYGVDPFGLELGYSTVWLCYLFVLGGIIRRSGEGLRLSGGKWLALFFIMSIATVASMPAIGWLAQGHPSLSGRELTLVQYTSPTVLLASIALFVTYVSRPDGVVRNPVVAKAFAIVSPATLGIYLIQCHPLLWNNVLRGLTAGFASLSAPVMVVAILGSALLLFLSCFLVERLRLALFDLLRVNQSCRRLLDGRFVGDLSN